MGLRYKVCARPIPAVRRTTDMVFPSAKVAVEVRGCYWHGCEQHHRLPQANQEYWIAKIERNKARDQRLEHLLSEAGWLLLVVWEHEDFMDAAESVASAVRRRRATQSRRSKNNQAS